MTTNIDGYSAKIRLEAIVHGEHGSADMLHPHVLKTFGTLTGREEKEAGLTSLLPMRSFEAGRAATMDICMTFNNSAV